MAHDWLSRVIAERNDLSARLVNLVSFIDGPKFAELRQIDAALLVRQRAVMGELLEVLNQRIERATEE